MQTVAEPAANNLLRLTAVVLERSILRYTPAGIAIVEARLRHESKQAQKAASVARTVEFELSAQFAGALADQAAGLALGCTVEVDGFLAARRQGSKSLVLHVMRFDRIAAELRREPNELNERSNEV